MLRSLIGSRPSAPAPTSVQMSLAPTIGVQETRVRNWEKGHREASEEDGAEHRQGEPSSEAKVVLSVQPCLTVFGYRRPWVLCPARSFSADTRTAPSARLTRLDIIER